MQIEKVDQNLLEIINGHVALEAQNWLEQKIRLILGNQSTKDLYLTYSLIPSKIEMISDIQFSSKNSELNCYLRKQNANIQQIARVYLLIKVLQADEDFFTSKIAKLIEIADTCELETFLKFLILLPNRESYKTTAVDTLRTNISTVFNAIVYNNPYPSLYFDDHQWNQMFLKTAFMQGDISAILDIDKRANKDLARIISDYAHERWAAGRNIDPDFWRPVTRFIDASLLTDMVRLLNSDDIVENRAAALCCFHSQNEKAKNLLNRHQELVRQIENGKLSWKTLKEA